MVKNLYCFSFFLLVYCGVTSAQIVGDNLFMQGHWLEIGAAKNGSMGSTRNAPAGYHQRPGTTLTLYDPASCTSASVANALSMVYDLGLDGWAAGTPTYMGDYTLPGTPYEGWGIQVGTVSNFGYFTSYQSAATGCNGFTSAGSATTATTGSFTSYSSSGGTMRAIWTGSTASGSLNIRKEYRLDTNASCLVITAVFTNTTGAALSNVYYMRTLDADNNEPISSSYSTNNNIDYQNDYYHRVLATSTAQGAASVTGTPANKIGLGTKDCRAKCFIYTSWSGSPSSYPIANYYNTTATGLGSPTYSGSLNGDYALCLVYNIGTIPANDSAIISYAYIFNGVSGIDSAFPEPKMVINGIPYDSIATDTICVGNNVNVNLINANDKNWSWSHWTWTGGPSGATLTDTGISNTIFASALTGPTTFTITGTDTAMGNCVAKTFLLTIIPVTTAGPPTRDSSYCRGVTAPPLSVLVSSPGVLTYYTTPTGGVGTTTAPVPSTATVGTFTYWVSQTILGCESSRSPITITVNPPFIVTLANNGPLCPGDNLVITLTDTITITSGVSYSWSGPGGYSAASQNVNITGVVYADSGVYTVTVNDNGCISDPVSSTVVVHATPPSPVFSSPTYCQFVPAVPLSATGSNILWYTSATGGTGSPVAPTPSTATAGVFTWYVTQTINNCESLRYPVTVTVNAKPPVPVITNNPGEYCPGQVFNTYTIVLGSNILWYTSATGGTGTTTAPSINTNVPGVYTYYASQTVLGCESDRTPVTVTVFNQVTAGFTYDITYRCTDDSVAFFNTSTGTINYLWDFGDGTSSNLVNPTHVYASQGVYTVKLYAHSANCVDSSIHVIDLRHPISAAFTISPQIVCQGQVVSFTDSATATNPSFFWDFGDGHTSTDSNATNVYANTGVYHVMMIVTDFVPCKDTAYGTVYVDSAGSLSVAVSDTAFCVGSYTTLSATYTTVGMTGFAWDMGNGDSVLNVNPVIYAYGTAGIFTVSASARYRACPPLSATRVISVTPQPELYVGSDFTVCDGSTSVLLADNINGSNSAASWLWSTGETTPAISVTMSGSYYVTVTINGCSATDSVTVTNDCELAMLNAFSPNGDGLNDYFNPRLYMGEGLKTFGMRIYNRWGQLIFETNNISGRGWDGRFNNELQPQGVYVYTFDAEFADGKKISRNGNVTLLRR